MKQQILKHITLLVRDYDDAIAFYCGKLGFDLHEDTPIDAMKRRVVVGPSGSDCSLLLARASDDEQIALIGKQCGQRVFLYLHTDDLDRDFHRLREQGVHILREPISADFGRALVFADLYGNRWDLVEPLRS
jgi:catechol 2,3-dioxygenase-like lactoylglutathione lyase family enzyme